MKNKLRETIKDILEEVLNIRKNKENFEIEIKNRITKYKFIHENQKYAVEFGVFTKFADYMVPDENIELIIKNSPNKYFINFGLLHENGDISDDITTNFGSHFNVLSYVISAIEIFLKENDVNIYTYHADVKRWNIYKRIYDIALKESFLFYTAKDNKKIPNKYPHYNVFLINNKLLNNIDTTTLVGFTGEIL